MKTPSFWYEKPGVVSRLLSPLSWTYGKVGRALVSLKTPQKFNVPVISIGNIVSGGSGKTPTTIALATLLLDKGKNVHIVSRGYGGKAQGPLQVNPKLHSAYDVGDEPLLLAEVAPTWIAKDRPQGVKVALEAGADFILLDDGHQTASLYKDISLIVVDQAQGFGNGCVIPAGPLRENLGEGMSRAQAVLSIGEGNLSFHKPSFKAKSVTQPTGLKRVLAFCGLGFPQKFYTSLQGQGLDIAATQSFPDHYLYKEMDLEKLLSLAQNHQADLITTRKDWVKLPKAWQDRVHVLDMIIQFEDPEGLYRFITHQL